ncbi:MAG: hypothetical protein MO852_06745 [Candidatus Devosia euplotis]|nr:hypothetical protein [Candidatus Devosia euplotis]
MRNGKRLPGFSASEEIRASNLMVLEGDPKSIEAFIGAAEISALGSEDHGGLRGKSLTPSKLIVFRILHGILSN